jgi:hypothetical protein
MSALGSKADIALGQKRTSEHVRAMSALPPKADMAKHRWDVRFVPIGGIGPNNDRLQWDNLRGRFWPIPPTARKGDQVDRLST